MSAEDARLRSQLELLRTKERRILDRLETVAAQMAKLRTKVETIEHQTLARGGKQPSDPDYGKTVWDVTELRY